MADNYQQPSVNDADAADNEIPPEAPPQPKSLNIKFTDTGGTEVHFKLKSTTKLKKAMDAYSARVQRDRQTLRFLFDGDRVLDDSTPESLGLEDDDDIEVHTEQIGGYGDLTIRTKQEPNANNGSNSDQGTLMAMAGEEGTSNDDTDSSHGLIMITMGEGARSGNGNDSANEAPNRLQRLNFSVANDFGKRVYFNMRSTTRLKNLMHAYVAREKIDPYGVTFIFNGKRVLDGDSAETLGIRDGDTIEVRAVYLEGLTTLTKKLEIH